MKGQYIHTSRENKQQNSFEKNISLWEGVLHLKGQYTQQATITKNISLWEGVLVLQSKYTEEATITWNISLWEGVLVLQSKYTEEATITWNISLWEGVLVLKGKYTQQATAFQGTFLFGREWWSWKDRVLLCFEQLVQLNRRIRRGYVPGAWGHRQHPSLSLSSSLRARCRWPRPGWHSPRKPSVHHGSPHRSDQRYAWHHLCGQDDGWLALWYPGCYHGAPSCGA